MNYNKKFYAKYGLKVTEDPIITHNDKAALPFIDKFHSLVVKQRMVSPQVIMGLERVVAAHPSVPSLKNFLYSAYMLSKQEEKAKAHLQATLEAHPNYMFAKCNLATQYIHEKNVSKAAATLVEPFDVRNLEAGEFTHISAFKNYYIVAIDIELERGNQDEARRYHRMLFDYDRNDEYTQKLSAKIFSYGFKNLQLESKAPNHREAEFIETPITGQYLYNEDGIPIFTHPEIYDLYEYSLNEISENILNNILALPRETLIRDLEHVVADMYLSQSRYEDLEWDESTQEFGLHAINLLAELKSYQSLPMLLDILRQNEEFMDFWFGSGSEDMLHMPFYLLGNNQLEILKDYVKEEGNYSWLRTVALNVAEQVALHTPERRQEVIDWFHDVIQFHLDNSTNNRLIDSVFLARVVSSALHIRAIELTEDIKALFGMGWISNKFCGNLESVLKELETPIELFYLIPLPENLTELNTGSYRKRRAKSTRNWEDYLKQDDYEDFFTRHSMGALFKNKDLKEDFDDDFDEDEEDEDDFPSYRMPQTPIKREEPKVGRNDPCPCGSGKKYKKCHG